MGDVQFTVPGGFDRIEISQGNPNGLFKIDPVGQTTGRITTAKEVPLNAPDQYALQVRVTDRAGQTATANVTVRVRTLVVIHGDSDAAEGGYDNIRLTIARPWGPTAQPLDVFFQYAWGTAVAADLEAPLAGTPVGALWKVTIPAGLTDTDITIKGATDVPIEGPETFRVELQESPTGAYALLNGEALAFSDPETHRGERNIDARILDRLTLFASDNPTAALKDLNDTGGLLNPGITTNDINQGGLGDCDFLAPVIALVQRMPLRLCSKRG